MDVIKALQILMAAMSASIIKEIYDISKQSESMKQFFADILMSTLVGTIVGFILQKYFDDILLVMGLSAASSLQGFHKFNKVFWNVVLFFFKSKGIDIDDNKKKEDKN